MPVPVSVTVSSASAVVAATASRTVMPPSKVNFRAFESRLSTTLAQRSRSTYTGSGSGGGSTLEREPEALAPRSRTCWPARGCSCPRSTGSKRASTRPDSSREKSSRVLTSLSSRCPLRRITSTRSRWRPRQRVVLVGDRVLGRPEQQGQRGAELVADVGEEVGLGLVELGERLGPVPLELVGAGVGEAGGELAGHQVAEVPVALVERPEPVQPEDLEAVGTAAGAGGQRDDEGLARADLPGAGGQVEERGPRGRRRPWTRPGRRPRPARPRPRHRPRWSAGRPGARRRTRRSRPAGRSRRRRTGRPARTAGRPGYAPAPRRRWRSSRPR